MNFGDSSPTVTVPLDATGSGQTTHTYTAGTFTATVNGNPTPVTVSPNPTTTTLSVTPNPSTCGQNVTVCATITPAPATTTVPTGTVTFTLPNGQTQMVPVNASGQACFTTTALTTGTLTAAYDGDSCFIGSTAGTPVTVNRTPTKLTGQPGTIRLRLTPLPEFYIPALSATLTTTSGMPVAGQPVTFTATTLFGPVNLGTAVTDANGTATIHNAIVPVFAVATPSTPPPSPALPATTPPPTTASCCSSPSRADLTGSETHVTWSAATGGTHRGPTGRAYRPVEGVGGTRGFQRRGSGREGGSSIGTVIGRPRRRKGGRTTRLRARELRSEGAPATVMTATTAHIGCQTATLTAQP